ncbi:hypothetical protein I551_3479 [Mycobacterium ulcerans str. Harvey]|uniref:Uncharacterized protein n=1 Tax=Mycobacterium ulcerans str. Harvey TaxID=1299332 RepID=A0ABN0QZF0_MYCUL|nr:hypothetical protein I551_3479 [Mycobacterium ulcerans str. Harvey]
MQHGLVKGTPGRCSRKISALLAPEAFSPLLSWLVRITDISAVRCPDCRRPRSPQSPGLPAGERGHKHVVEDAAVEAAASSS